MEDPQVQSAQYIRKQLPTSNILLHITHLQPWWVFPIAKVQYLAASTPLVHCSVSVIEITLEDMCYNVQCESRASQRIPLQLPKLLAGTTGVANCSAFQPAT